MAEIKNDFGGSRGVKMDEKANKEKQKKVLEQMRLQEAENDKQFVEINDLMIRIVDVVDNGDFDVEQKKTFNDEISLFNEVLLRYDNVDSLNNCVDAMACQDVLNKQKKIIDALNDKIQSACKIINIDLDAIKNSSDVVNNQSNVINPDNNSNGGDNAKQLSWHEIKEEVQQHAKDNKQIDDEWKKVSAEISKRDKSIENLKGQKRKDAVLELKKFKEKAIKNLHQIIQEKIAAAEQRQAIKKEILAEFGGLGTVYEQKKGSYRRFQIIKYSDGFDEVTYSENSANNTVKIDEFRKIIAEGQFSKFYVPIKIEKEFAIGKVLEPKNGSTDKFPAIRVTKYNKAEKIFNVKKFLGKKGEFVTMKEDELRAFIKDGDYILQSERLQTKKENTQNGDSQLDENQNVTEDDQKYEIIGVEEDVNFIFDIKEIQEYIGTGKSKKTKERQSRIKTYKKEIIESITEIEKVANRKINRIQFTIDYVNEKRAKTIIKILEKTIEDVHTKEQLEDIQKTRDAADITFAQMDAQKVSVEKLNANTEQIGDEKFKEMTRETWKEFAVRSFLVKDREVGEIKVNGRTNTDSKVALYLLQKAGMNVKDVTYLAPSEFNSGKINIDTGKKDGLIILEDGTVIIDHHGEDSPLDTSAASEVRDILVRLGMLEKSEGTERLIEFVNQVDNFDYVDAEKYFKDYFKNAHETVLGTYRMLSPQQLESFFAYKKPKTGELLSPSEPLSIAFRRKFYIENQPNNKKESRGQKAKKEIENQHERLEQMEKEGLIVNSDRYGKICVVTEGSFYNDAVRAYGCDTVIFWNKDEAGVFMSSLVGKPIEDTFEQGENIRKTMWIKSKSSDDKLTMQLKDILEKMTDGKLIPSEKLQKVLDNNGERTDRVELTEDEKRRINIYIKHTKDTLQFVKEINLSDFGITKAKDVANKKRELVKKVWEELENDITKGSRFTSGQTKDIIDIMKDKL